MTEVLPDPEPRPGSRPLLGELLVNAGLVTPEVMAKALAEQQRTGLPIGRILVEGGYIPGHRLAMALADQHGGPVRTEYGFATGHAQPIAPAPLQQVAPEMPTLRVVEAEPAQGPDLPAVPAPAPEPVPAQPVAAPAPAPVPAGAPPDDSERERLAADLAQAETSLQDVVRLLEQEQEARGAAEAAAAEAREDAVRERASREQAETRVVELQQAGLAVEEVARRLQQEQEARAQAETAAGEAREEAARARSEREQAESRLRDVAQVLAQEKSARETAEGRVAELEKAQVPADELEHERQARAEAEAGLAALRSELAAAQEKLVELEAVVAASAVDPRAYPIDRHLLYVPGTDKYRLLERTGPPPATDARVELESGVYTVSRLGPAPIPERVACAFLEAVNDEAPE